MTMRSLVTSDNLAEFGLTAETFPEFYNKIASIRFPIAVEEVLDLRSLINHTADSFEDPSDSPQNREFQESLLTAIHSFGIENSHHCERLLRLLAVVRGLHYQHTIDSRNSEQRLRLAQADNRMAHSRSMLYGIYSLLAMTVCAVGWSMTKQPGWPIKLLTLVFAVLGLDYFHSLPKLDRERDSLSRELNEVLRKRVENLNWRTLIHKLALILGYKQIKGIEVFRHDDEHSYARHPRSLH
ncbi:MAG: hypothetical protein ACYDHM_00775 [Acidiferrobacterales bacterium]